jgi:hypothetical protein
MEHDTRLGNGSTPHTDRTEKNQGGDPKRDSPAGKLLADAAGWDNGPSTHRE